MTRKLIGHLVLNLLWVSSFAQGRFNIIHDNGNGERANAVILGDSGKYICTGTSEAHDYYTAAFKSAGNFAWSLLTSSTNKLNNTYGEISFSVLLKDHCYYIMGAVYDSTEDASTSRLNKIDLNGKIIWSKYINGGYNDWGMDIQALNDSEFVTFGHYFKDSITQSFDLLLMFIDSSGSIKNKQRFGGVKNDHARRLCITRDKEFICTGYTYSYGSTGYNNAYIYKAHSDGTPAWLKTYGGTRGDYGLDITEMHNGDYLFVGGQDLSSIDTDALIVRTDTSGKEIWKRTYVNTVGGDEFTGVGQLPGGDILVCGSSTQMINGHSELVGMGMRLSEKNGDIIWKRFYKYPPSVDNYFYGMALTPDGGMVMAGMAIFTDSRKNDFWVVKVDSLGCDSLNCIVTGIDELEVQTIGELKIYPNPSIGGPITVQAVLPLNEKQAQLVIYDILGKEIERRRIFAKQEVLSSLPKGVLMFSLFIDGELHDRERVVIE